MDGDGTGKTLNASVAGTPTFNPAPNGCAEANPATTKTHRTVLRSIYFHFSLFGIVRNWQGEIPVTATTAAERRILIGLAAFAMVWAIVRAHVQAVTMDEAVTYTNFVLPAEPAFWTAHANNHLLNSMLAWCFARVFGTSNLVARSGALIGAAMYIVASYFLSGLIADRFLLRASLFICLVFNPFIFDFLVAARGTGLASGFLLSAICFVAYALMLEVNARRVANACVAASLCIALSFVSNFSFALRGYRHHRHAIFLGLRRRVAQKATTLAAACFLPGLLLAGALAGPGAPALETIRAKLRGGLAQGNLRESLSGFLLRIEPSVRELVFIDRSARHCVVVLRVRGLAGIAGFDPLAISAD